MKALITAGGHGTRLRPITWTVNKHLIPLANEPMLFNALKKVAAVGVKEVAVNINPGDTEIAAACGDGSRWGLHITYIEQQGGPVGVGQIIWNAKSWIGDDDILLYFGDNVVLGSLQKFVDKFVNEKLDCCLAFSKVPDPQRFGVPEFDSAGKLIGVAEKPAQPKSDFAVTGIYLYKAPIHYKAFENIIPSARGEYEISDIHDWLLKNNYQVGYEVVTGWWKDTGKPEDLLEGNQLLLNEMAVEDAIIAPDVKIDDSVKIQGRVKIGAGSRIGPSVLIRGPVVIGENVTVENSFIGPHSAISEGAIIQGAEIEHSIIMPKARINTRKRIVDSIIGENVTIADDDANWPRGHRMVVGQNSYLEL